MRYTLTLNEKQAEVLQKALDFYSRTLIGQFEGLIQLFLGTRAAELEKPPPEALWDPDRDGVWPKEFWLGNNRGDQVHSPISRLKALIVGQPMNGSYGIHSPQVDDQARQAFDLMRVIRGTLAWAKNPKGTFQVWFDRVDLASTEVTELAVMRPTEEAPHEKVWEEALGALRENARWHPEAPLLRDRGGEHYTYGDFLTGLSKGDAFAKDLLSKALLKGLAVLSQESPK